MLAFAVVEFVVPFAAISIGEQWIDSSVTGLLIAMVPLFGWALLHDGGNDPLWRWVAFALFAFAMITDKIDGDLARKHNLITNFGKIADPIADKALTGMAFVGLSIIGELWWWVTIVVLVREWGITALRFSNVMAPEDYAAFAGYDADATLRSGTCGATSTPGTAPRPCCGRSSWVVRASMSSSLPQPTP